MLLRYHLIHGFLSNRIEFGETGHLESLSSDKKVADATSAREPCYNKKTPA